MFLIIFSFIFSGSLFSNEQITKNLKLWESDYHNFNITKSLRSHLSANDTIELSISNPTSKDFIFFLVFEDEKSSDYWSKLNFKSTIVPGENVLSFDLKRFIGERGSIKYQRSLDFHSLKKMYVVINPNKKNKDNHSVKIKSIILKRNTKLEKPKEMKAFKFISEKSVKKIPDFFTKITSSTKINSIHKTGFSSINLWRVNDSQASPEYLSETLGVYSAKFKVMLPPGDYEYELNWNELGYWDVPFWNNRMFYIDSKPERKETRSSMEDFFDDYLQFMKEPSKNAHPYNYYLKKTFSPVTGSFSIKKQFVEFSFEGDATGVSLNTLFIWPKKITKDVLAFKKELEKNNKAKFNQKFREVKKKKPYCELTKKISITTSADGLASSDICFDSGKSQSIKFVLSDLKSNQNIIKKEAIELLSYVYQFKSIDLNHETYQLQTDYLRPLSDFTVQANGYARRQLHFKLRGRSFLPGIYKSRLVIVKDKIEEIIPIEITILKSKISNLPIKAGVLGLTPLAHLYFNSPDKKELSARFYTQAYSLLKEAGLSLFTGTPSVEIEYDTATYKDFKVNTKRADDFIRNVDERELFFYNEPFPSKIFLGNERHSSQSTDVYFSNLKKQLEIFSKKHSSKEMFYLYSDEATGYRNAVDSDKMKIKQFKKVYPSLKLGGFGNLYDWDKGKSLYQLWDFALYTDIPDRSFIKKLKKQKFGLYNLCAEPTKDLSFCFGVQLYLLSKSKIKYYFEWHASAIHNYPGFDLDGRESDIGFFYPGENGEVLVTKRYTQASQGVEILRKILILESFISRSKGAGKNLVKAKKWISRLNNLTIFPVKGFYSRNYTKLSSFEEELNIHLKALNL